MTNPRSTEGGSEGGTKDRKKDRKRVRKRDSTKGRKKEGEQETGERAVLRAIRDPGPGLRRRPREGGDESESRARHPSAAQRTPARRETGATSGAQVGPSVETALGVLAVLLVGLVSAALSPL